jgi:hypothetical protein
MGLLSSFKTKDKTSGGPHTVPLEEHERGDDLTSKAEATSAVREASVDKDAVVKTEEDADAAPRVADDESKYPTGPKLWLLVTGLCLAIWVVALDNSSTFAPSSVHLHVVVVRSITDCYLFL